MDPALLKEGNEMETEHSWEERSFPELYDAYFDAVNRYLRSRAHHYWDGDDLTATVFMKALEHFAKYDRSKSFEAWIFRIAHNTYIDYLRKKKEVLSDQEAVFDDRTDRTWQPEEQALSKETRDELQQTLEQLTHDQRDVLMLRYFGDLKHSQIGQVIGKSESAIKVISRRALARLKKLYFTKEGTE
jgi:RNA polymerase sigma factor (sigma-70 family)